MLRYPTQLVSARRAIYDDGGRPYLILVNRRSNVCRVQNLSNVSLVLPALWWWILMALGNSFRKSLIFPRKNGQG
jgi:hypothetical protein